MNKRTNAKVLKWIVCIALCLVGTSQAFDGFGGYWGQQFPWFGYGNNGPAAYSLGNIPAPPYFALHPPVYYSRPLPRTYGGSPFACSCNCNHAGRQVAASRVIVNPHIQVKPTEPPAAPPESAAKPVKVASLPQRITNPHYGE
jgi:hypothetical protein